VWLQSRKEVKEGPALLGRQRAEHGVLDRVDDSVELDQETHPRVGDLDEFAASVVRIRRSARETTVPELVDAYQQWAALNLVDRHTGDDKALVDVIVQGLVVGDTEARTILRTLDDLGLLHRVNGVWRPSSAGADLLSLERQRVAAVTARLLDGIAATDLVTAVRVLDQVRERAQEERTRLL
jgi:hypothetical protein